MLPDSVRYLIADGYYYRFKFWNAVRDADLNLSGKLRVDANLNDIYTMKKMALLSLWCKMYLIIHLPL